MMNEAPYWSIGTFTKVGHFKVNNLIIKFYHENKISIEDFFHLPEDDWPRENIHDASIKKDPITKFGNILSTGWYYIVDTSDYKRQLDKTQEYYFIYQVTDCHN